MNEASGPGDRSASGSGGPDLGIPGLEDAAEIGRGGFGIVYRARQAAFNRTVAVKVVTAVSLDEDTRRRFEREREAIGTISSHPNIVTVFESGYTASDQPYLLMEYMAHGSLADRLAGEGPIPWDEAVASAVKIAGALETVHRAGILHRDIKPENILMSAYGEPHLGDFGIARMVAGPETRSSGITTSVAHAAPEILGGTRPQVASDVYALGSTLFTFIDGRPAFVRDTDETVVALIGRISLEPVPDLRPRGVPDGVCRVMERSMAKKAAERHASAAEFGRELQDAQRASNQAVTPLLLEPGPAGAPSSTEGEVADVGATTGALGQTPLPPPGGPVPAGVPVPAAPPAPPTPPVAPPPPVAFPPVAGAAPPGGRRGKRTWVWVGAALALVALLAGILVAVGGGGDGDAVAGLDDVKLATVRIEAKGTFVDPEIGQLEGAGTGSGFIIDPEGIAVTNNHVVVGAASLQVYVEGDTAPKNAKVLGVSECADLAVIDIDGGGYPFLEWSDETLKTGIDVFAFGFPLDDPEITQTRGIISKAAAAGETTWASVDDAIEHDATINPGSSGGPLVLSDGTVIGVNYATLAETDQSFAISSEGAKNTVERLREREKPHSIGINGQAVFDEESGTSGVWVAGVASGSPADKTGIQPGDIITHLENVTLAEDGTMANYCDVLRSHDTGDTLSVEVLRSESQEVLKGQINGRELELSFSFAEEEAAGIAEGESYTEYTEVVDETGSLSVEVPIEWGDVDGTQTDIGDGTLAPGILASPDIAAFGSYTSPGVAMLLFGDTGGDPSAVVDTSLDTGAATLSADCAASEGRQDYDDGVYVGKFDLYTGCGAAGSTAYIVAAYESGFDFLVTVIVNAVTTADLEALDHALSTFLVL